MLTIGTDADTWLVHRVLEQRAAERPNHPVMHWEGQDYTYAAVNREANRIAEGCPGLGTFIVAGGEIEDARRALPGVVLSLDEVAAGDGADAPRSIEATTTACIMFTSGTTGPSKGVVINNHFELSFAVVFNEIVSLRADDVTYNFFPFFHIAGKFIMLGTMLADCRMLLRACFSAGRFWPDVRAHDVTVGVGGICHMLWAEPSRPDDADNPLRMIYSVPNPHDVQEEFLERFGLQLTEGTAPPRPTSSSTPGPTSRRPRARPGAPRPTTRWRSSTSWTDRCRPAPRARSWCAPDTPTS